MFIKQTCDYCKKEFIKSLKHFNKHKLKSYKNVFCNNQCHANYKRDLNTVKTNCKFCSKELVVSKAKFVKFPNSFCNHSCAATYQNAHKTTGTRRSKLEMWLEKELTSLYQNYEIHFNRKDAINSELDIYFPQLKLAFELNGVFHYEPIYGAEKLASIQNNDQRKFAACIEKGISLCVIDTSKIKYFKESTSRPILDIIINIIKGQCTNRT